MEYYYCFDDDLCIECKGTAISLTEAEFFDENFYRSDNYIDSEIIQNLVNLGWIQSSKCSFFNKDVDEDEAFNQLSSIKNLEFNAIVQELMM